MNFCVWEVTLLQYRQDFLIFWTKYNDLWSKKICRPIKMIVWSGATFILIWSCFLFLPEFQHLPFQKIGSAQLCFKTSIIWRQTFWFTDKLIFANIRDLRKSRVWAMLWDKTFQFNDNGSRALFGILAAKTSIGCTVHTTRRFMEHWK